MFYHPDRARIRHYSGESSRTTHGAQECIDACRRVGEMLAAHSTAREGPDILFSDDAADIEYRALRAHRARRLSPREETFQVAAMSCIAWKQRSGASWTTDSFAAAILQAANAATTPTPPPLLRPDRPAPTMASPAFPSLARSS